jgi:hypothetical protein
MQACLKLLPAILPARMSERIMLFMIRELFASSLMLTLRARQGLFKFAPGKFIRSSHKNQE